MSVTTKLSNVEQAFDNGGKNLHCFFLSKSVQEEKMKLLCM